MTKDELYKELMQDDTKYCCYCGEAQMDKWRCCGENHFESFAEMDDWQQENFMIDTGYDDV